jgi:hypothetical protein
MDRPLKAFRLALCLGICLSGCLLTGLGCRTPTSSGVEKVPPIDEEAGPVVVGFAVGGPGWPQPELEGIEDPKAYEQTRARIGFRDAQLIHGMGGTLLRFPYWLYDVIGDDAKAVLENDIPVYKVPLTDRINRLDRIEEMLRKTLEMFPKGRNFAGQPLRWEVLDGYIGQVEAFNKTVDDPATYVRILMCLVVIPPQFILESPAKETLKWHGRDYEFATLWDLYVRVQIQFMRMVVRRYVTRSESARGHTGIPAVAAIEVINEPDYQWLPNEVRIEKSLDPAAYPVGKYVTELHFSQIPSSPRINGSAEQTDYGFRDQDMDWSGLPAETSSPVSAFDWGRKFDRYVLACAQLLKHVSFAARDEGNQGRHPLAIVSGSVTHNNVDYLRRMYQADQEVFRWVDKIGVHPYHWPDHDIWRTDFVSSVDKSRWLEASPRDFAMKYFKRFDFIEEVARLTAMADPAASFGVAGKKIWVTEFGIPTKKVGVANTGFESLPIFIYERGARAPTNLKSIVWEDKWDAFLQQVSADYLRKNNIEALLIYTLREGLHGESGDDEHSNFALLHRNGRPRMADETLARLKAWFASAREPARLDGPGR